MPHVKPLTSPRTHLRRTAAALCLTGLLALPSYRVDAQNTAIAYAYPAG